MGLKPESALLYGSGSRSSWPASCWDFRTDRGRLRVRAGRCGTVERASLAKLVDSRGNCCRSASALLPERPSSSHRARFTFVASRLGTPGRRRNLGGGPVLLDAFLAETRSIAAFRGHA